MKSLNLKAEDLGVSLVGFADLEGLRKLNAWPRAISLALALNPHALEGVEDGPTREYYEAYRCANAQLNRIAEETAALISAEGHRAEAMPATMSDEELSGDSLRATFQHKTAATRAGLGFIGKSALLITPVYGPRVRLATVLTDLPLEAGLPITQGSCRSCHLCADACPARAIKGQEWEAGMPRETLVDAQACWKEARRKLLERVGVEASVCGICMVVCPKARRT